MQFGGKNSTSLTSLTKIRRYKMKVFLVCLFAVIAGSFGEENAVKEITKRMYYPGYPTSSVGAISAGSVGSNFQSSASNADKFIHIKANRQGYPGGIVDPGWGAWGHAGYPGAYPTGYPGGYPGAYPIYPGHHVSSVIVPAPMPMPMPVPVPMPVAVHQVPAVAYPAPTIVGVGHHYPGPVGWAGAAYPGPMYGGVYPGGMYPGGVYPGGMYPGGGAFYPYGGGSASLEATLAKSASHSAVQNSNHMSYIDGHAATSSGYPGAYPYPYYK